MSSSRCVRRERGEDTASIFLFVLIRAIRDQKRRRSRLAPPFCVLCALLSKTPRLRGGELKFHTLGDEAFELVDTDADLLHGVAVAQGDGVVFQGLEVDGDAARRVGLYRKYSGLPTGMICSG